MLTPCANAFVAGSYNCFAGCVCAAHAARVSGGAGKPGLGLFLSLNIDFESF